MYHLKVDNSSELPCVVFGKRLHIFWKADYFVTNMRLEKNKIQTQHKPWPVRTLGQIKITSDMQSHSQIPVRRAKVVLYKCIHVL